MNQRFEDQLSENMLLNDDQKDALRTFVDTAPSELVDELTDDLFFQNQAFDKIIAEFKAKVKENFAFYKGTVLADNKLSPSEKDDLIKKADSELAELLSLI